MSTTGPDSNGLITKKFNLKGGAGNMDRVAFYVLAITGYSDDDINPAAAYCSGCDISSYQVIGAGGNSNQCDLSQFTTDGATFETNTGGTTSNSAEY